MARNDFATLKTRVQQEMHDNSLSSKVGDWVNEAMHDINNRTNHRFLRRSTSFATVASQQAYSIVTDIAATADIITNITSRDPDTNLVEYPKKEIELFDPDYAATSTDPWAYWVENMTLGLYPTPNAVKTLYVDYIKAAVDMSADADTPDIPLQWVHVIVDGAVFRGQRWLRPNNPPAWQSAEQRYEAGVRMMMAYNQRKPNIRYKMKASTEITGLPVAPRVIV